jgi:hypothetical protein
MSFHDAQGWLQQRSVRRPVSRRLLRVNLNQHMGCSLTNWSLRLYCGCFTAYRTYLVACVGRTGQQYSPSHLDLLLNHRDFTGREHFGLVR